MHSLIILTTLVKFLSADLVAPPPPSDEDNDVIAAAASNGENIANTTRLESTLSSEN